MKGAVLTGVIRVRKRGEDLPKRLLEDDSTEVLEGSPAELVELVVRIRH